MEGLALDMIFDELFNNSNCLLLALGPIWLVSATISTDVVPQLLTLEPFVRKEAAVADRGQTVMIKTHKDVCGCWTTSLMSHLFITFSSSSQTSQVFNRHRVNPQMVSNHVLCMECVKQLLFNHLCVTGECVLGDDLPLCYTKVDITIMVIFCDKPQKRHS